jgi:hypothetical protein
MPPPPELDSVAMMDDLETHIEKMLKEFPLRPAEDDISQDAVAAKLGLPRPEKTAEQGIRDMQARIDMLKGDKAQLLNAMDGATGDRFNELTVTLDTFNRDLAEAETRLAEYKAQAGLN